jgi:hypothetical protein
MTIDIDEAKVKRNEFGLWFAWTMATTLGMLLGYLPAAFVVGEIEYGIARVFVPLLAGLLIGLAQWLVLRGYVTDSRDWILYHAGGWVAGYAIGLFAVDALAGVPFGGLLGFILFGVIVAVFQWPVLRREIPNLLPWILANVIGWTLAAFVSQLAAGAFFQSEPASQGGTNLFTSTLIVVGITGLIGGAITALALIWIVRKPERVIEVNHVS